MTSIISDITPVHSIPSQRVLLSLIKRRSNGYRYSLCRMNGRFFGKRDGKDRNKRPDQKRRFGPRLKTTQERLRTSVFPLEDPRPLKSTGWVLEDGWGTWGRGRVRSHGEWTWCFEERPEEQGSGGEGQVRGVTGNHQTGFVMSLIQWVTDLGRYRGKTGVLFLVQGIDSRRPRVRKFWINFTREKGLTNVRVCVKTLK